MSRRFKILVTFATALTLGVVPPALAQRFHASDPLLEDDDQLIDVSEEPAEIELSDMYDRFGHIFHISGDPPFPAFVEAQNMNTLDEVPNSSWFTNRHGASRLSIDELVTASNVDGPPNPDETWTIIAGKSQGITPGFTIVDGQGDRYVIKFDPVGIPELSTAAEAIGTKIFWALGYHVPQNYVVRFHPDNFAIEEGTMVKDTWGDSVPLTDLRVRRMIRRVPKDDAGRMRVIASKYIEGTPIGPFRYFGTRSDDPNDVIPHEHRRELRGLRMFAAWTNHDDTRAQNTQASWVAAAGRHHVRHWLIDFGSTFGSGSVDLQLPNLSFHYWFPADQMKKNAIGFGFHTPYYRKVKWPNFPKYEGVGRWESEHFDPLAWRNDYPNPAFVRTTPRDAFWAAKILMRFTREELRAITDTANFVDSDQAQYFLDVLMERQQKTGALGINGLNPLDGFTVSGDALEFENLSERYGYVEPGSTSYGITWSLYDNRTASVQRALGGAQTHQTTGSRLPDPHPGDPNLLLMAEITSTHADHPVWEHLVRVYLRPTGSSYEVVGIDRDSPRAYLAMQ